MKAMVRLILRFLFKLYFRYESWRQPKEVKDALSKFNVAFQESLQELVDERDTYADNADIKLLLWSKLKRRGVDTRGIKIYKEKN